MTQKVMDAPIRRKKCVVLHSLPPLPLYCSAPCSWPPFSARTYIAHLISLPLSLVRMLNDLEQAHDRIVGQTGGNFIGDGTYDEEEGRHKKFQIMKHKAEEEPPPEAGAEGAEGAAAADGAAGADGAKAPAPPAPHKYHEEAHRPKMPKVT